MGIARPPARIVNTALRALVLLIYGRNLEGNDNLSDNLRFLRYAFLQRLLGFNRRVPWPVHFTSVVVHHDRIRLGSRVNRGDNPGCYIQGVNGIIFGSNIRIGANVCIVSANHSQDDYDRWDPADPIRIGDNVWIGANTVILPGVQIGDNVIVGAGSVVTTSIPDDSVAAGNPCRVLRKKPPYKGRIYA
ncbi:MAG: DapH/DapD/GlmU-related protein [Dehalococcoidia bacterium]|nr:DapH/DapD/GlmU-related protein [Dehalococcoidia bacterium]